MQAAPKFGKIELIFNNGPAITHGDCGMFITGNHFVIVIDKIDSIQNTQTSEGIFYNLSTLESYKTHKQ